MSVVQSRRKQAKPRSVKDSNASLRGASVCLRGPSGTIEAPIGPLSSIGGAGCLTSAPSVKCDSCGLLCDNLDDFIEHQNTECRNGLNGGSGTPSSWRSSDGGCTTPEEASSLSPLASSCETPDGQDLPDFGYTIGVTENTPYACQFCDKAFPRLSYLKRHEQVLHPQIYKQVHSDKMPFRCDYCQRLFKHKRSRDRHVKLHTGDKKYKCTQCVAAFSRSDHLKIHMKTHDQGKPYQCSMCNRGYNTAAALTSHMQNHRKSAAETQARGEPHDPARISSPVSMLNQRQSDSPDPTTPSPLLMSTMSAMQSLATRKERLSRSPSSDNRGPVLSSPLIPPFTSSPTPPVCSICSRSDFGTIENLQLHIQAMHMPPPHFPTMMPSAISSLVGKNFNFSLARLAAQRLSPPESSAAESYNCDYCPLKLPTMHALHAHAIAAHSYNEILAKIIEARAAMASIDPVSCPQCRVDFPNRLALTEHMRLAHTDLGTGGPGPFICSQCSQASPDFESFRTHLASHLEGINKVSRVCPECQAEFGSSQQLETHVASHFLQQTVEYSCQPCNRAFSSNEELQKHLMESHSQKLYRCALCRDVFDTKAEAQQHFIEKHSEEARVFRCSSCKSNYRSEPEFSLHVQVTHLAKASPYRCLLCKETFPSEPLLQRHVETHGRQFPCSMCDQAFHVEFLLEKHMQSAHSTPEVHNLSLTIKPTKSAPTTTNGVSLLCAYCNESCKSRSELEAHMKLHPHGSTGGKHKCNICDEIFSNVSALAEHKLTHCKVTVGSTCAICREVLKTEKEFAEHVSNHGGSGTGLPLPCVICRQTLMSEVELQIHAKFHIGSSSATSAEATKICEMCHTQNDNLARAPNGKISCQECFEQGVKQAKVEKCPDCGVKFESRTELDRHECRRSEQPAAKKSKQVDTPISKVKSQNLECSKCHVVLDSASELAAHFETHRETAASVASTPAFECMLCHAGLDTAANLQVHLIEHNFQGCHGFTCYFCSSIFTTARSLSNHLPMQHAVENKPFDCTRCDQTFYFRAELENHELTEHHESSSTSVSEERSALEPEVQMTEDADEEELVVA
ncbi:zinc finger protein 423-like isoform X4 [Varroa destructor]|uniref:C2H2-type domain-containing protein n=1 Tax=Varroa destructor TaxID=109461 RepID=A0A7M7MFY2_VARDE|nr:zinc finger protein 423-like isoform X4 [Varroa destructor]